MDLGNPSIPGALSTSPWLGRGRGTGAAPRRDAGLAGEGRQQRSVLLLHHLVVQVARPGTR
eukprot:5177799-Prorocentrum_lima.AAC.1